jgi:hypothetical protein
VIVFRRERTGGIIGGGNVPSLISFTPYVPKSGHRVGYRDAQCVQSMLIYINAWTA